MQQRSSHLPKILISSLLLGAISSQAQTTEWNTITDDWFTATNWSNGLPDPMIQSRINNGGTAEVTGSGAETLNLILGDPASSSGTLSVTGSGTFNSADFLTVGSNGTGFLNILSGGTVTAVNSSIAQGTGNGTTTVSGVGSLLDINNDLTSGSTGTGILNIESQGTVENDGLALIGAASGANGTVNVTGAGSSWTARDFLAVGNSGTGILNITNGGSVSVDNIADVGSLSGSTGTLLVDGSGSQYIQAGGDDLSLAIAYEGTGVATVSNGGVIDHNSITSDLLIALEAGSTGTLNIGGAAGASATGAGIIKATGIEGGNGSATVNLNHNETSYALTDDGTTSGNALILSGNLTVNHNGSGTTTILGTHAYVGGTAINDGTLVINGSIDSATTVNSGGELGGSGTINANVLVQSNGVLAPGNSPGVLTMNSLDLEGGATVAIELGGTSVMDFDQLNILGDANIDGTLEISYVDGFTANAGDQFTILSADDLTGIFSTIILPDAQDWDVLYDNNTVRVTIIPEPSTVFLVAAALPLLFRRKK